MTPELKRTSESSLLNPSHLNRMEIQLVKEHINSRESFMDELEKSTLSKAHPYEGAPGEETPKGRLGESGILDGTVGEVRNDNSMRESAPLNRCSFEGASL